MAMVLRIAGGRKGRWAWGAVALLLVAGLAGTFVGASRAAEQAREDAAARGERYAETVLFENLDPRLVEEQILGPLYRQGTILGPKYRALLIAVQDAILIDPFVVRVRIWDSNGLLIFSTDDRDSIGATDTVDPEALATALGGGTTTTFPSEDGLEVERTVTPLRIPGKLAIAAVAGIDQDAERIAADARAPWSSARLPLAAALVLSLGLVGVALARPEPLPRRAREVRVVAEEAADTRRLRGDVEDLRARLEAATSQLDGTASELARVTSDLARVTEERDAARAELVQIAERFGVEVPAASDDVWALRETLEFSLKDTALAATRVERLEADLADSLEKLRLAEERIRELEGALPGSEVGLAEGGGAEGLSEKQLREYELSLRNAAARQLRGPVSRIRGVALSLKHEVKSESGKDLVQRLSLASDKLDRLVADLESLSRLVDGSLPLQRWNTEVDRFVERVVSEWRRETDRTVLVDAQPVSVPVDQARLRQVLEGLLDDADSRAAERDVVKVKVRAHEGGALISVEGTEEGAAASRTDIQLAIVRRLVEIHGGRIWSERRRDGASAVMVMFPSGDRPDERVPDR